MSSHGSTGKWVTYIAGEDLSSDQYKFVIIDSTNEDQVVKSGANGKVAGILMNSPASGQAAEVAVIGQRAKLKIAEAVSTPDKYLTSTSLALGEIADAAGEHVGAMAVQSGATNDVIEVDVVCFTAHASDA